MLGGSHTRLSRGLRKKNNGQEDGSTIDLRLRSPFTGGVSTCCGFCLCLSGRQLTRNASKTPPSPSKRPRNMTRLLDDRGYSSRSRRTSSQTPEERPNRLDQPSPSPSLRNVCLCVGRGSSKDSVAMIAPPRRRGGVDVSLRR